MLSLFYFKYRQEIYYEDSKDIEDRFFVLYGDLNNKRSISLLQYVVFVIRRSVYAYAIVYLSESPTLQVTIAVSLNAAVNSIHV